jgi:hypothetical protein
MSVATCEPGCPCGDVTLCGARAPYVYAWGNNPRRAELKGRVCVVEARGALNTVLVAFVDTGERVTTSRRALRPVDRRVTDRAGRRDQQLRLAPQPLEGLA